RITPFASQKNGSHHFSCGPLHFELFGYGGGWMFPSDRVALCSQGIQIPKFHHQ
ncbi:hypothetical protein ElyMa_006967600, partial [Elysia marginata]